jgi:hypothetical protein
MGETDNTLSPAVSLRADTGLSSSGVKRSAKLDGARSQFSFS